MPLRIKIGETLGFARSFLAIATLVFSASFAFAETEVTAQVDRNALNPDDTLLLTVSISSSEDVAASDPELPALQDFEILNQWTGQEHRATMVTTPRGPQFKTVNRLNYNYMLQPKRQGNLLIGAVSVAVDGRTYNTKPITIKVAQGAGMQAPNRGRPQLPPGFQPPPGMFDEEDEDLFSQLLRRGQPPPGAGGSRQLPINPNEAFFVQVETDKTEAYVGEQVTVSFYLYTRGQIRDLDTLKYPSLKGFWKEDIEIATHLNFQQEIVNGLPYKKALLASFALFPIKEGTSTIDSYTAKCSVIQDALGSFGFGKAYTFTKSSQPVKITVKPIPAEGRPADYSGAVGDFQVTARVEDKNVVEGQPFTLKVRFEGRGNAKLIELPPFQPPEGMELYDTQNDAKFYRTGTSYKDFSLLLIPRRQGQFTIPSMSVSLFDPNQRKFVAKQTEAITVNVGQGTGNPVAGKSLSLSEKVEKAEKDETPRIQLEWKDYQPFSPAQRGIGLVGIFGLIGATLFWRARTELGWGQRKKDLLRQLHARFRRVHTAMGKNDYRAVGVEATNAVYFVLGEISGEGGANTELEKLLLKAPPSVRRELAEPLKRQMDIFQVLSFAPESLAETIGKDPAQLKKAVTEMESLMERAVALGVSASQSDGSDPDPKAS